MKTTVLAVAAVLMIIVLTPPAAYSGAKPKYTIEPNANRLLKKSLCGSAGSISGDVLTWIDPSFSILEPLRESFLAVHFASRVFQQPAKIYGAVKGRMDIVDTLVKFVKAHGNRCDSVSSASDNMFSKGYTLICNKYNYKSVVSGKKREAHSLKP